MATEEPVSKTYPCLRVRQPLGEFYIASISARDLVEITYFDVRRVMRDQRDIEKYLGIQRPLQQDRVDEISQYVATVDAVFPTGVIVAIDSKCVDLNDEGTAITLSNFINEDDEEENILFSNIARVLDGQHRIAGLEVALDQGRLENEFEINVVIFVGVDISDQANVFATVNLAQTKVRKSLVYDLYDLMKARSPQRTCHNIAVTLDAEENSPFHRQIKRLGVATVGRAQETITQSTFIEPLIKYISVNPMKDRDLYLRGKKPEKIGIEQLVKCPFQHMFVDERDFEITDIVWNYFEAVRARWPGAWQNRNRGAILTRTNGYRAFMRFLRPLYLHLKRPGEVLAVDEVRGVLNALRLQDGDFNTDVYAPGTSGESRLYRDLLDQSGFTDNERTLIEMHSVAR